MLQSLQGKAESSPSLRNYAILSLGIHILFILITAFVVGRPQRLKLPPVYRVSIVTPTEIGGGRVKKIKTIKAERRKRLLRKKRIVEPPKPKTIIPKTEARPKAVEPKKTFVAAKDDVVKKTKAKKKESVKENIKKDLNRVKEQERIRAEKLIKERIAAIKAKKRVEKIVNLRKEVLSITKTLEKKDDEQVSETGSIGKGNFGAGYEEIIRNRIWGEWVYPSVVSGEELETVVTIKIRKNGTVEIMGVDKSSGVALFDRSTLRAIKKASPLPPPPKEMLVTLRFTP